MLWVVSEASKKQHEVEEEMASDFSFLGEATDSDSGGEGSKEERVFMLEHREESSSGDDSKDSKCQGSGKSSGESGKSSGGKSSGGKSSGGTARSTSTMMYGSTEVLTRLGRELSCMGLEDAACLLDPKGRIIFANEAFLRNNGYEESEASELVWTNLLCPGTDRDVMSQFEVFLAEHGSNPFEARMLLRRKNGTTYWGALLSEAVTFHSNGYVVPCFCLSVEDATELVDAEAEGDLDDNTLVCAMCEELAELQHRCVQRFKLGLAHVETTASTDPSSDEDDKEKGPFTEILLALPAGTSHTHSTRCLTILKERGVVQSFVWEAETLRIYANINALYRCMEYVEPVKDSWPVAMGFKQWLLTVLTATPPDAFPEVQVKRTYIFLL
jgi:PAS domain S-box-containing protein